MTVALSILTPIITSALKNVLTLIPLGGGGGGPLWPPPVIFFAVHLDRLEFRVQTSWLFSLKSPAYFDI